jgi:adenosylcobinamide-GDP ribazoletransferase
MGTVFIENIDKNVLLINLLILFVFSMIPWYRAIMFTACFAAIAVSYFISILIEEKIGGMTGDTCGFITEISQIVFMTIVLFLMRQI